MFQEKDLNEFINMMFENAINTKSDVKEGLVTCRKYLSDTSMCDDEYLRILDKIIECSQELLSLKKKMNNFDIVSFVEQSLNNQVENVVPKKKKKTLVRSIVSDRCGSSSSSTNNRCGGTSTYSDSCGGGSYTNRC